MRSRRTRAGGAAILAVSFAIPIAITAASGAAEETMIEADPIVVRAPNARERALDAPAPVTAIGRDEAQTRLQPSSPADLLRLVPGMTTQSAEGDPGVGVNVRGMQDFGRVSVTVDGARQNFQREGHSNKGSFYFDPEMMKSVEVSRGPGAGPGGAIGGVVAFTTIDAGDLLRPGETVAGRLKFGMESNRWTPILHGELAARPSEGFDILGAATWRSANDYRAGGGEPVDHTAQELVSGLVKARLRPADDTEITVSAMRIANDFENGLTTIYRNRVVADTYVAGYRWRPDSDIWNLSVRGYFSGTDVRQTATTGLDRGGVKTFDIGTTGLDVSNLSRFQTGSFSHEITYGGEVFHDRVRTTDSFGASADLTPSGERVVGGGFVQDRVSLTPWLDVIGGFRLDAYTMSSGRSEKGGARASPKATLAVTPWQPVTFYAAYSEGYRPPALIETFIDGFHPPPISVGRFFPNPDLKAETARNIEAGINLRFDGVAVADDRLRMKAGVFRNRVSDYIEQVFVPFPIPGGYQYQNIAEGLLEGVEIEGFYDSGAVFAGLGAHAIRGTNVKTGEDLVKVPPNRLTGTLGFRALDGRIEAGTRVTLVGGKDAETFGYVGDPYALVGLFASFKIDERRTAALVVENLFDRRYTDYLNALSSPGLNVKATLSVRLN